MNLHGGKIITRHALYRFSFAAMTTLNTNPQKTVSISSQARRRKTGKFVQTGFFLIFLIVGLAFGYFLILPGFMKSLDAKNWVETPCMVLESRVQSHSGSDSTTYSVEILYTYTYADQNHRSSQYEFIGGSSSGYEGKAAAVRKYPAGGQAVCYVNPKNPAEAVIKRELGAKAFLALFPLAFILAGLAGIVFTFRKTPDAARLAPGRRPPLSLQETIPRNTAQVTLIPSTSHAGQVIASLAVSLFWNGIVSVFVYEAFQGWQAGNPDYFLMIFLIPFVLIGLVFVFGIFYFFLAAFNPRPALTLSIHPVRLGETVRLNWSTDGDVYKIQNFKLTLIGEESARYRQGKNTSTDRHPFYNKVLADLFQPEQMRRGETDFQIPGTSMHSFQSANNGIAWKLSLHCDVPMWPDLREEFEISVLPPETKGGSK